MSAWPPPLPEPLPPESSAGPRLVSFVIRFVHDAEPGGAAGTAGWHGLIRHVQSGAERYFTQWAEAEAFVRQFVTIHL